MTQLIPVTEVGVRPDPVRPVTLRDAVAVHESVYEMPPVSLQLLNVCW